MKEKLGLISVGQYLRFFKVPRVLMTSSRISRRVSEHFEKSEGSKESFQVDWEVGGNPRK